MEAPLTATPRPTRMTTLSIEIPTHLAARLDRIAGERRTSREELARELLAGVVDRETERVAAELRRIKWRRDGRIPSRRPN